MRLVIIDLTGGLLTNAEMSALRNGAGEMLAGLMRQYRLAAFADVPEAGVGLRSKLETLDLGAYFETVTTSRDLGGTLSPAGTRSIAATVGTPATEVAVISANPGVVETLHMAGVVALLAEPATPVTDLPQALAWVTAISSG